jgi:hypothetical protein
VLSPSRHAYPSAGTKELDGLRKEVKDLREQLKRANEVRMVDAGGGVCFDPLTQSFVLLPWLPFYSLSSLTQESETTAESLQGAQKELRDLRSGKLDSQKLQTELGQLRTKVDAAAVEKQRLETENKKVISFAFCCVCLTVLSLTLAAALPA